MNHTDMNRTALTGSPSLMHRLLIAPRYRVFRHVLLAFIIAIISLNQACMTFLDGLPVLGNLIYLQAALTFASYMVVGYYNFLVLLPRYLLRKQYVRYGGMLLLSVALLVIFQTIEEYCLLSHFHIHNVSYDFPVVLLNTLSAFALIFLALSGPAMTILLKYWLTENEKVVELEKRHVQSEVERLKEQVSPQLLFSVLNRAGKQAVQHPADASALLLRLSQLLRYQLYDCNREQVLLSSEIKFLSNYLTLEQSHSRAFTFSIRQDEESAYTLVAPLLFIAFVQAAVLRIYAQGNPTALALDFRTTPGGILFECDSQPVPLFSGIDFSKIHRRLDLLYRGRYELHTTDHCIILTLSL